MALRTRIQLACFTNGEGTLQRGTPDGPPASADATPPPARYLDWSHRGAARLLVRLKRLLRPLVVLLYLCPLLVLARLVFRLLGSSAGDWVTVAFVGLVLLFFTLFALLMLLIPLAGPRSKRRRFPRLRTGACPVRQALELLGQPPAGPNEADALRRLDPTALGGPLRLRGRLRGAAAGEEPRRLLRDAWHNDGERAVRLTTYEPFWLLPEGDDGAPPLAIAPGDGLWLLGDYAPAAALDPQVQLADVGAWARAADLPPELLRATGSSGTDGQWWAHELRDGMTVELVAPGGATTLASLDAALVEGQPLPPPPGLTGAGPYRGQRTLPALQLNASAATPVLLLAVDRAD